MSMSVKTICDHCEKEIEGEEINEVIVNINGEDVDFDLCSECLGKEVEERR
jgi:hypothetical protein